MIGCLASLVIIAEENEEDKERNIGDIHTNLAMRHTFQFPVERQARDVGHPEILANHLEDREAGEETTLVISPRPRQPLPPLYLYRCGPPPTNSTDDGRSLHPFRDGVRMAN